MIGDLYQLSPVAKQHEWQIIKEYYESVYFFSSKALAYTELVTIELKHIYRQSDVGFIKLLNNVRDNNLTRATLKSLNQHYIENFTPKTEEGYITLTTHNRSAEQINQNKLDDLSENEHIFKAEVSGEFSEHTFPTLETLCLKKGAQVMFVRNDSSAEKLYYNGKIGKISEIFNDHIIVVCPEETKEITVKPIVWENIKYTINKETREIEEEVIGKFEQYPLKLAWAITIHKSQGLTFEKAIIDANAAFAHGQVYVALSRCKTLEGMVLSSPVSSVGVETDISVKEFTKSTRQNHPSKERLQKAKVHFQQKLLLDCFDFKLLQNRLDYLVRLLLGNKSVLHVSGIKDISDFRNRAQKNIFIVSEKFLRQLISIYKEDSLPESDNYLHERITKASIWFQEKFTKGFKDSIDKLYIETDNTKLRTKINNALNNLKQEISIRLAGVQSLEKGFSPSLYLKFVANAVIDYTPAKAKKQKPPDYSKADIEHPELFETLKNWRTDKVKKQGVPAFCIMHQKVLIQITMILPDNFVDLRKISGIGKKTIENYGDELVAMVLAYKEKI